jgi:hypothetical protein
MIEAIAMTNTGIDDNANERISRDGETFAFRIMITTKMIQLAMT